MKSILLFMLPNCNFLAATIVEEHSRQYSDEFDGLENIRVYETSNAKGKVVPHERDPNGIYDYLVSDSNNEDGGKWLKIPNPSIANDITNTLGVPVVASYKNPKVLGMLLWCLQDMFQKAGMLLAKRQ